MSETAQQTAQQQENAEPLPDLDIPSRRAAIDWATVLGLISTLGFIIAAIAISPSNANFFNLPAFLLVIFGTITATAMSYTWPEIVKAGTIIRKTVVNRRFNPSKLASSLLDLAVVARKNGVLALSSYENDLKKNPHLASVLQMVIDGFVADDIERMLAQENESLIERHKRSASITRRASEVAPAMGLIGTLVGLVQMLADLENPETIGPAMAVALLTTFYGAILGTVIMAPLAIKLEKHSADESLEKTLIMTAALSIARSDNPRRLEMLLNSELPPAERINYFE